MNKLISTLKEKKFLVSDGAWGTELFKKGFQSGSCPELWNLEKPEVIFSIAKSYNEAGSDIISTNSFGASKIKLDNFGLGDKTYLINKKAAELSREAAKDKLVMGSVGPSGKFLISGEISEHDLSNSFLPQLQGLIDGGVDAIIFETFYDLDELICGIKTLNQFSKIPVIASFTFNKNNDGKYYTLMGNQISEVYKIIVENNIDFSGVNCGNGYFDSIEIVREIKNQFPELKLLVQPNAGLPEIKDNQLMYSESADKIIPAVKNFIETDVKIIGGCCGTTPEHIKVIRKIVDEMF
jgi:5-methyltetrahydrofolate--homocysteine methyltransferase